VVNCALLSEGREHAIFGLLKEFLCLENCWLYRTKKLNLPGLPRDKLMESGFLVKSIIAGFSYAGFQFLNLTFNFTEFREVGRYCDRIIRFHFKIVLQESSINAAGLSASLLETLCCTSTFSFLKTHSWRKLSLWAVPLKRVVETGKNWVWELSVIAQPLAMETSRVFRLPTHLALVELITCTGRDLTGLNNVCSYQFGMPHRRTATITTRNSGVSYKRLTNSPNWSNEDLSCM